MTDTDLTDAEREALALLPATLPTLVDELGIARTTVKGRLYRAEDKGVTLEQTWMGGDAPVWHIADPGPTDLEAQDPPEPPEDEPDGTDTDTDIPDGWTEEPVADADPDPSDLTGRQRYLVRELQTAADPADLREDLDVPGTVLAEHLRDLRARGWQVYHDDTADTVAIEGEHVLRSSEHTGTRTRKANRWWELRHNELVREYKGLSTPATTLHAEAGHEDWVLHLTDLHAGDRVRQDDGTVVYETAAIPDLVDYVTERALALAEKHNSSYDTAHLLWGGDFVTNEGIYEGQFEDLDAWLDEQHDTLVAPLVRQLKAFSRRFPSVQVVCQVGNHGQHRANGTSRQANADLILYKHIRNLVAHLQEHAGLLENVAVEVGQARPYRNFELRGGRLRGHLRHGQDRRPQAETAARESEWRGTLLEHEFDVAYLGHHHVGGRIPWDGPPVIASPSPKPGGEFVERLGGNTPSRHQGVATAHGVGDEGLTSIWPIDTRHYDPDDSDP